MFGLFASQGVDKGKGSVEKRVLCFSSQDASEQSTGSDPLGDVLEVKVYRSKGRKRIKSQVQDFKKFGIGNNLIRDSTKQNGGIR